jgi:hydroxyacylglutathione hydrolase
VTGKAPFPGMLPTAMPMKIVPVACLSDNYAYLVMCEATKEVAIVDPSEPEPVIRALATAGVTPRAIWNTHHHHDHTGGNAALAEHYGLTWVSGHASDKGRIEGQTRFLEAGARFTLGELDVEILHIPGHTLGAIAYVVRDGRGKGHEKGREIALFTGDTMFHGGCGRLFEGTPAQMLASLQALVAVGDDARVYPGHEYTVGNLRFAHSVEPGHKAVADALAEAQALRDTGAPTVGTTIARERETNPFVRVSSPEIRKSLGIDSGADAASALGVIREAKNGFK